MDFEDIYRQLSTTLREIQTSNNPSPLISEAKRIYEKGLPESKDDLALGLILCLAAHRRTQISSFDSADQDWAQATIAFPHLEGAATRRPVFKFVEAHQPQTKYKVRLVHKGPEEVDVAYTFLKLVPQKGDSLHLNGEADGREVLHVQWEYLFENDVDVTLTLGDYIDPQTQKPHPIYRGFYPRSLPWRPDTTEEELEDLDDLRGV